MQYLKMIFGLFSQTERKRAFVLFIMTIIMAFMDVVGVSSVLPFMAVVADQSLLETNKYLSRAYEIGQVYGFRSPNQFLTLLGIVMFILILISLYI